jgi:hypothetical protein
MKTKATWKDRQEELRFELKYCERCGGLWLRPAGGGQTYCVGCARQMGELPMRSGEREASEKKGKLRRVEARRASDEDTGTDTQSAGGVA